MRTKSATSVVLPDPAGAVTSVTACARFCWQTLDEARARQKRRRGARRQKLGAQEESGELRHGRPGRLRVVDVPFLSVRQVGHRFTAKGARKGRRAGGLPSLVLRAWRSKTFLPGVVWLGSITQTRLTDSSPARIKRPIQNCHRGTETQRLNSNLKSELSNQTLWVSVHLWPILLAQAVPKDLRGDLTSRSERRPV